MFIFITTTSYSGCSDVKLVSLYALINQYLVFLPVLIWNQSDIQKIY